MPYRIRITPIKVTATGCWLWGGATSRTRSGIYGHVRIRGKVWTTHRLIFTQANSLLRGEVVKADDICHTCDHTLCVNPRHLFAGTRLDNMKDCCVKGRAARKLTAKKVRAIRRLVKRGLTRTQVARQFGISGTQVGYIVNGHQWKYLTA